MPNPAFTSNTPTSNNHVKETGFSFVCSHTPDTVYHLQGANVPGITGSPINVGTPLSPVMIPGDNLEYEPLTVTFMVDEEIANWRELHTWMDHLYTAKNTADLTTLRDGRFISDALGGGVTDATLTIRSNKQNPTCRVKFHEIFPTSLSELQFTTASDGAENLVATCVFSYNTYTIDYLKDS